MAARKLSIIIPAYSGEKTIYETLYSIFGQKGVKNFEIVIVQDGPKKELTKIISESIKSAPVDVRYQILSKNVGRFEARLKAAALARTDQLLFIDDRVQLANDFISKLNSIKSDLLIGNVIEKDTGLNIISNTLSQLRKSIYGAQFGKSFRDYYITSDNFERTPKGTASLYINKHLFMDTCSKVASQKSAANSRFFNEDTGLMRSLVNSGHKILRTSKLQIYYQPRAGFKESAWHLYDRGPRFVDYYVAPRSRFFIILAGYYLLILSIILFLIFYYRYLLLAFVAMLALDIFVAIAIGKKLGQVFRLVVGLPLVIVIFGAGIIKGTLIRAMGVLR